MKENELIEIEGEKLLKVYMFPIEGNHDSTGEGINCPDPRERKPLPLYQCVGLVCCFQKGTYKDSDGNCFVLCSWDTNKTVEENIKDKNL